MTLFRTLFSALAFAATIGFAAPVSAEPTPGIAKIELRPGWRMADGTHMAALHIALEPGWKTYWRAPGDAGIPPQFDWAGSRNIRSVSTSWPTPQVFFEQGMRSVGYTSDVVIPLHLSPTSGGADIHLEGDMKIGICKDICIPAQLSFKATLPPSVTRPDPAIAAALTNRPYTAREANVGAVTCRVEPARNGGLILHTRIEMPSVGAREFVVIEADNPHVWVAEPESTREGAFLTASTRLVHVEGRSFVLDRSKLRFTVIGPARAVDIKGCTP